MKYSYVLLCAFLLSCGCTFAMQDSVDPRFPTIDQYYPLTKKFIQAVGAIEDEMVKRASILPIKELLSIKTQALVLFKELLVVTLCNTVSASSPAILNVTRERLQKIIDCAESFMLTER